jgi:murein DD-endopeptidase MepM/ murein hydrolase activator NlpD
MRPNRLYTFIVAPNAGARAWRFSLSYPALAVVGGLALFGLVSAGTGAYHYARMLLQVADHDHLLKENNAFRSENHNFRIQTAQLGEKLDLLETMSRKLMLVSGLNDERRVGGIGGFSKENFSTPRSAKAGTLASIAAYNKRVDALEEEYRDLTEKVSDRQLLQASLPVIPPVVGYVTGGMGRREDPLNADVIDRHVGVDISAPHGKQVVATADGIVVYASAREGYGNIVVIDHKFGWATRYAHLSKISVQVGQRVSRSDAIGYVGATGRATGPHLHYEIWCNNKAVNPLPYLSRQHRG